jgi:carbamoyl-phosphate synthase / aspartate carbamoyltransferase
MAVEAVHRNIMSPSSAPNGNEGGGSPEGAGPERNGSMPANASSLGSLNDSRPTLGRGFPSTGNAKSASEQPEQPVSPPIGMTTEKRMVLELRDGTTCQGFSFGAARSIAGELVFQTGMVGYPEAITDPSYSGQILVMTFPLVGNYGVPSRTARDKTLHELPAYFEAARIHVAGLVVASYSGEDYSHHLAVSSLGTWLKEQGVPAIYGVDTRVLTQTIRVQGSMLGRLLLESESGAGTATNGPDGLSENVARSSWREGYENVDWVDPNKKNLVAAGGGAPILLHSLG